MRPLSVLTALIVAAALYGVVFERDRLLAWSGREVAAEAATELQAADGEAGGAQAGEARSAAPPPGVRVVAVDSTAERIDNAITVRGQTLANRQVEVRAEVAGLVINAPLRAGARVEAGDVLCEIDPSTRPAQLAEAEARLSEAQINDRAAERLAEGGFGSETRRAEARAALQAAEAAVELARAEIDRLTLRAPFAGYLEEDAAELGSFLQPGATCATILQLDPIKLMTYIPETAIGAVSEGATATARLTGGREVDGTVTFISRSADPDTRTFRIEVTVDNADGAIRDGQTASITLSSEGVAAHFVPASALTLDDEGEMGLRLVGDDGRATFAPVEIVRDTTDGVWVSGPPAEARIIVVGQEFVTEGSPVAPTMRSADG